MGWLKRLFGEDTPDQTETKRDSSVRDPRMGPGLTGQYDWDLREKAGMHEPPLPPVRLGLEGEFDEQGLAKRVAAAFDRVPELEAISTVTLRQEGSSIILEGAVPDQETIARLVDVASSVDGTQAVDTRKMVVAVP